MNKTAFITGASVGIGNSIAQSLAEAGYQLVLLARREDKLIQLAEQLSPVPCHIIACDINDKAAIEEALINLPETFKEIDVLVNNAGLALGLETAENTSWEDWQLMIDTNCISLSFLTRKLLPNMKALNKGHIINMSSIAGSYAYKGGNVYGATKAFVDQFSANLRTDLLGSNIRVSNIQPGLLGNTEFSLVRFHGNQKAAKQTYDGCQPLMPEDVAQTVLFVVSQPAHVNINSIELMPTCQAAGGLAVHKN